MVHMAQDRRGFPGSLKRDQESRAKRELPHWVIEGLTATGPSQLDRIEAKLDALLEALADEGEETEQRELTLDGEAVGGQRDDSQSL